jgi:hypothetical protein
VLPLDVLQVLVGAEVLDATVDSVIVEAGDGSGIKEVVMTDDSFSDMVGHLNFKDIYGADWLVESEASIVDVP